MDSHQHTDTTTMRIRCPITCNKYKITKLVTSNDWPKYGARDCLFLDGALLLALYSDLVTVVKDPWQEGKKEVIINSDVLLVATSLAMIAGSADAKMQVLRAGGVLNAIKVTLFESCVKFEVAEELRQSEDATTLHQKLQFLQRCFEKLNVQGSATLIKSIFTARFEGASAAKIEEYALTKKAANKFNANQELIDNKAERSKVGPGMLRHVILIGLPNNGAWAAHIALLWTSKLKFSPHVKRLKEIVELVGNTSSPINVMSASQQMALLVEALASSHLQCGKGCETRICYKCQKPRHIAWDCSRSKAIVDVAVAGISNGTLTLLYLFAPSACQDSICAKWTLFTWYGAQWHVKSPVCCTC